MRLLHGALILAIAACGVAAYQQRFITVPQPMSTAPKPRTAPTASSQENPNQEINDRFVKQIAERIAGRENEPAKRVFKNLHIPWFKNPPAAQLLDVMNGGYSRALGVSCTYCHVEQDFASDDKRPKRAAREMATMHRMINQQLIKMQNLETKVENRGINCSTCHRGAVNPTATDK